MTTTTTTTPERWQRLIESLSRGLIERDSAVRLALLAALAGEHVLLIGPPGTAKSALARRLHAAFDGTRYFERLLTRFSTPEELFGPLSLKALEDDRYERLTDGFLPTAGIAFLDEVFKANSAILNALLTLLNEREFDNGTRRVQTPLVAVVGASNEVPTDEALQAFFDRFLVRVPVAPVGDDHFESLLALDEDALAVRVAAPVTVAEREALQRAAAGVRLGAGFVDGCTALRRWLAHERESALSDRRWRQFVALARTAAAAEARDTLDAYDLWLAPYVAAARPEQGPAVGDWFEHTLLALPAAEAPWLERAVQAFERQLQIEQSMPAEDPSAADSGKLALALARAIGLGEGDGDGGTVAPRLYSAALEQRSRRHWSRVHVRCRVEQVAQIEAQIGRERDALAARARAQALALAARWWMPRALHERLNGSYVAALRTLDALGRRLAAAREGFAALPVRADADDDANDAPAPVMIAPATPEPAGA